jgi:hypothetical protein
MLTIWKLALDDSGNIGTPPSPTALSTSINAYSIFYSTTDNTVFIGGKTNSYRASIWSGNLPSPSFTTNVLALLIALWLFLFLAQSILVLSILLEVLSLIMDMELSFGQTILQSF